MVNLKELTKDEIKNLIIHVGLKKVKVKTDFKYIMYKKNEGEYSKKDDAFFEHYAGKTVFAYPYSKMNKDDDWFILSENNHCLTMECFETTHNSSFNEIETSHNCERCMKS